MTAKTLMIMGTHSNAGKSILVTALCRIFAQMGYRVAPFKAQNMALNAGVTPEGHEIGRATVAQAEAAGIPAHVDMNPVLLKPEGNARSQVVLDGRAHTHIEAHNWLELKNMLWPHVTAALARLRARHDLVIIEGAGSPAEINLKAGDIVNMRVARHAQAPVLLAGDIDRGGVFAALVGTMVLLEPEERTLVKGFIINKFRGDIGLLGEGLQLLQERAFNIPTLGVIPYLPNIGVAEEDSVALAEARSPLPAEPTSQPVDIAVIRLPRIANFDDFDPLLAETGVRVRFVDRPEALGRPAAIILPGSKMTVADLKWMRETGLADIVVALARLKTPLVGICGGYQLMGQRLFDPDGVEAKPGASLAGLGLLPIDTTFVGDKRTVQVSATLAADHGPFAELKAAPIQGYEIHLGRSRPAAGQDEPAPLCFIGAGADAHPDGAISEDGLRWGTYLHGLFENDALRQAWLRSLGWQSSGQSFDRQRAYNRLADHVRQNLDLAAVQRIIWE